MGTLLRIVGFVWVSLGLVNIISQDWSGETMLAWSILLNFGIYWFPALVLIGIGCCIPKKNKVKVEEPIDLKGYELVDKDTRRHRMRNMI